MVVGVFMSKVFCLLLCLGFLKADAEKDRMFSLLDAYERTIDQLNEESKSRHKSFRSIMYLQSSLLFLIFAALGYSCYKVYQFKKSIQSDDE